MEKNREEQEIIRNEDGTFVKGVSGNPAGRTKGTRDFATDFDEVVKDIAKENNLTVSDVRKVLLKQAYKQAKDGNYSFFKDIHDRIYGQAKQTTELTGKDGKDLIPDKQSEEKAQEAIDSFLNKK